MKDVRSTNSIDMTTGAILPKLLATALPLMASSVLQLLFNAADVVVVGNFASEHSLAAVGSTGPLVNLVTNLFVGLSIGANTVASFYFGAKDDEKLGRTVHNSMMLSLVGGVFLSFVGVVFARTFLIWMQTPDVALDLAALYVRVYFAGSIPLMIFNFGSSLLRAKGDTKRPLYYLLWTGVLNVALNLLFVVVFDMDVAGVALATIIAQAVAALLVVRCMCREADAFRLNLKKIKEVDSAIVGQILRTGIPAGIQGIVFSLSNVVIQASINGFGPIAMAGSAAASNVEGFVWVSMYSFSQTVLTFVGQNVGAKRYDRLNRIVGVTLICTTIVGFVMGNFCCIFGESLTRLYDSRQEVVASAMTRFNLVCKYYCICGLMDAMVGVIRGMGVSVTPTIVSLIGACGLRLVWIATIFQVPRFHSEGMLFASYPISWTVTFAAHLACFFILRRRLQKRGTAF